MGWSHGLSRDGRHSQTGRYPKMYKSLCKNKWKMEEKKGQERFFDCGVCYCRTTHIDRETTQKELLKTCENCEFAKVSK
jgi:hypothetical protein